MAAHGICFDFYYCPKPSQIGQNSSEVAADARLAAISESHFRVLPRHSIHKRLEV